MGKGNRHHILAFAAVLAVTLAALAFYDVRDYLAAFALFSFVCLALGGALLLVYSAEEAVVWAMHRTGNYFDRLRGRHLVMAADAAHHRR